MALMSKKTAKRISDAINDIRVSEYMREPTSVGMSTKTGDEKTAYFNTWYKVGADAKEVLRNLGIEVV